MIFNVSIRRCLNVEIYGIYFYKNVPVMVVLHLCPLTYIMSNFVSFLKWTYKYYIEAFTFILDKNKNC